MASLSREGISDTIFSGKKGARIRNSSPEIVSGAVSSFLSLTLRDGLNAHYYVPDRQKTRPDGSLLQESRHHATGVCKRGRFIAVEASPISLATQAVDSLVAAAFDGRMGTQPVVYKHLALHNRGRGKYLSFRIIESLRIIAHVAATTDVLTGTVAENT